MAIITQPTVMPLLWVTLSDFVDLTLKGAREIHCFLENPREWNLDVRESGRIFIFVAVEIIPGTKIERTTKLVTGRTHTHEIPAIRVVFPESEAAALSELS